MSSIFGGSASKSTSSNQNNQLLTNTFTPQMQTGVQGNTQMANMLGLNGAQGQNQAFQNWQNSTGYKFGLNQGIESINGNAATQGLMNSGATAKALETYGQNYANTQYGNYMNQLQNLVGNGNQAGQMLANSGQVQSSTGQGANGGIGGLISDGIGSILNGGAGAALGNVGSFAGSLAALL